MSLEAEPRINVSRIIIQITDDLITYIPVQAVRHGVQTARSRSAKGNFFRLCSQEIREQPASIGDETKCSIELFLVSGSILDCIPHRLSHATWQRRIGSMRAINFPRADRKSVV